MTVPVQPSNVWSTCASPLISSSGATLQASSKTQLSLGSSEGTLIDLLEDIDEQVPLSQQNLYEAPTLHPLLRQQGHEGGFSQELRESFQELPQKIGLSATMDLLSFNDAEPVNETKSTEFGALPGKQEQNLEATTFDRGMGVKIDGDRYKQGSSWQSKGCQIRQVEESRDQSKQNDIEQGDENASSEIVQVRSHPVFQRAISAPTAPLHPESQKEKEISRSQSAKPRPQARATLPSPKKGSFWTQMIGSISPRAQSRVELLCESSKLGDLSGTRALLEAGAEIDGVGHNGYTPLGIAIKAGQVEVASLLLQEGADLSKGWKAKWTKEFSRHKYDVRNPIHIAAETGSVELVDLLIHYGADVNDASGCIESQKRRLPLHFASNEDVMLTLFKEGANAISFGADHPEDQTPLNEAILRKRVACVQLLLERDTSISLSDPNKTRALSQACSIRGSMESFEIIRLLIAHGCSMQPRIAEEQIENPLSTFCSRPTTLNQHDVNSMMALIDAGAAQNQDTQDNALRELCQNLRFQDTSLRCGMMQHLVSVGANVSNANALHKIFAVFIFHSKEDPDEERLIEQFLHISIPLIKTGASTDGVIQRIQAIQSVIQRGELPFPNDFGEFWFSEDLKFLNNKSANKRMEICLAFLNWTKWTGVDRGLEELEQYTEDFWTLLGKTGMSPRIVSIRSVN